MILITDTTQQWIQFLSPLMTALLTILYIWSSKLQAARQNRQETKIDQVHTLVNGDRGATLSTVLEQATKIATLTQDPADIAKVQAASEQLDEHRASQEQIAALKGKTNGKP